jgi:hypothetical protein
MGYFTDQEYAKEEYNKQMEERIDRDDGDWYPGRPDTPEDFGNSDSEYDSEEEEEPEYDWELKEETDKENRSIKLAQLFCKFHGGKPPSDERQNLTLSS